MQGGFSLKGVRKSLKKREARDPENEMMEKEVFHAIVAGVRIFYKREE